MVKNPVLRNAPVFILSGEKNMWRAAKGELDKKPPNKNSVFIGAKKTKKNKTITTLQLESSQSGSHHSRCDSSIE